MLSGQQALSLERQEVAADRLVGNSEAGGDITDPQGA